MHHRNQLPCFARMKWLQEKSSSSSFFFDISTELVCILVFHLYCNEKKNPRKIEIHSQHTLTKVLWGMEAQHVIVNCALNNTHQKRNYSGNSFYLTSFMHEYLEFKNKDKCVNSNLKSNKNTQHEHIFIFIKWIFWWMDAL